MTEGAQRAVDALESAGVEYDVVRTQPANSAEESASLQGIELAQLLKTIVVRKGEGDYVFVLVPADREIDWRKLRKALGVSRAAIPPRAEAESLTGFNVGAITPFGSQRALPVVVDVAAARHRFVALGGGERGVNIHISPSDLSTATGATSADVTSERSA